MKIFSFILSYKIHNNIFDCEEDKKYFLSKVWAQRGLDKTQKQYAEDSYQWKSTDQMYYSIYITKSHLKKKPKAIHPLQLNIDCQYNK
ncbi:hypothetical protein MNB_SM-4-611 [hydrothermal vent metagenome]|uniref:Uncharacterized protein n=1 Tax=hydrothermal vent metagenome TaxID=652676 RepID=A0A1W1CWD8_9ZZZZ